MNEEWNLVFGEEDGYVMMVKRHILRSNYALLDEEGNILAEIAVLIHEQLCSPYLRIEVPVSSIFCEFVME